VQCDVDIVINLDLVQSHLRHFYQQQPPHHSRSSMRAFTAISLTISITAYQRLKSLRYNFSSLLLPENGGTGGSHGRFKALEVGSGEGCCNPSPVRGSGGYAPENFSKNQCWNCVFFCIFASWNGLISSVSKARLGTILLLQFILPPGTNSPQLRATRPPGHQKGVFRPCCLGCKSNSQTHLPHTPHTTYALAPF